MPQTAPQISFLSTSWSFMWPFAWCCLWNEFWIFLVSHKNRDITSQFVSLWHLHCIDPLRNKIKRFFRYSLPSFLIFGVSKEPLSKFWFQLPLTLGDSWFWSAVWNGFVIEVLTFYSLIFLQLMFPLFLSFIFVYIPFQPPPVLSLPYERLYAPESSLSQVQKRNIEEAFRVANFCFHLRNEF